MEKVQKLYRHPLYRECLEKNKKAEETRIFCKHGMEHFMDVARIAYILSVDRAYAVSKEIIYAAALLHDIGKWKQYEDGTPHEKASADLADVYKRQVEMIFLQMDVSFQGMHFMKKATTVTTTGR